MSQQVLLHLQWEILSTVYDLQLTSTSQGRTWHNPQLIASQVQQDELAPRQPIRNVAHIVSTQAQPLQVAQRYKAVRNGFQCTLLHDKLGESCEGCQA